MRFKCPKCCENIVFIDNATSITCRCGQVNLNIKNMDKQKANDIARLFDSARWRKLIEEQPECGEGYKWVIYRHRTVQLEFNRIFRFVSEFHRKAKELNVEWRPVYEDWE